MLAVLSLVSLAVSVLATPLVNREDVSCETIYSGGLLWTSKTFPAGIPAGFQYTSQASAFLALESDSSIEFAFQQCDSSFMGYQTTSNGTATVSYGHIAIVDSAQTDSCLTTGGPTVAGSPYLILNDECLYEDSSLQLVQYWSLTNDSVTGNLSIAFIGVSASGSTIGDSGNLSYPYGIWDFDSTPAITTVSYKEAGVPSDYQIYFTS
ncbi:uncharacterized protein FIBRA_01566 [Fibroporia radiculosa]|uniref:Uncharacterized protein n=1 Tax=Fibroporia radiculosa TaxID=599839 RepID=J4G122_9APHY|nr:uncharacterized protein FIBRA_01566 [Fibroporia radiculosa]CCL99548.1 predicted protein [Fibroporia radiculosa]